jgi:hypothetical protein
MVEPVVRRRFLMLALATAGLFVGWVASAGANLPQLPQVPPPPKVPTLPLLPPPPLVPQVPPVSIPKVPATPPVSHPSVPVHVGGLAGSYESASGGAQNARPSRAGPTKVYSLHFSRDWIARSGPKKGRQTILSFVLRRPMLVEFVVFQISPECRRLGRFRVQGRRGLNRVRFRGRIGRRVLGPGTDRIKARTVSGRRALAEKRLVVVSRVNKEEIAAARGADACATGRGGNTRSLGATGGSANGAGTSHHATGGAVNGKTSKPRPSRSHGVLGTRFTRNAVDAIKSIPLWLYVLLGLAIALLAVAALPLRVAPNGRTAGILAHRRGLIALTGAAALVAVTVSYALH